MTESVVRKRNIAIKLVIISIIIIWLLWTITPLFIMAISSIKTRREAFATPEIGDWIGALKIFRFKPTIVHYKALFVGGGFGTYLWHSLVASLGSSVIAVALGTLGAYGLSRGKFKQEDNLSFWIISTRMAPAVAVIVPLYYVFRKLGILQTIPGLIVAYTTFNLSFSMWLIKGFFDDIPIEIEEAAFVDGDTHWDVFRKISLPLAAPGITASFVLCVLLSWNDFLFAAVLGGGPAKTLPVGITELQTAVEVRWGPINAAIIVLVIPKAVTLNKSPSM